MTSYHGGKQKSGKQISEFIVNFTSKYVKNNYIKGYWEPFCGMMSVYKHVIAGLGSSTVDTNL